MYLTIKRKATKEISSGNYFKRIDLKRSKTKDELSELSNNFNIMANNLEKLEQMRSDFVSNVTHELKTPLTSIKGFVEILLNSDLVNETKTVKKSLNIIDIETERLYNLINDILQLSEIEAKQKDSNIGLYNLNSIADEVLSLLKNSYEKKGITITKDIENDVFVNVNKDRMKELLINLLDNSIKYNKENGKVFLKAYKVNCEARENPNPGVR